MDIKISKADVIWSYVAQFLQMASGILILPYILHKLPASEIGLNYLMLTLGSMVALLDFGFAPQFGRNVSYIYGGAQVLKKEGVEYSEGKDINYRLLAVMIKVARKVYFYLSLIVLLVMLTGGTVYYYSITEGFTLVRNSILIWGVYIASVYFEIYFKYYSSLLIGSGKIKESKYAIIASRLTYMVLCILFVAMGLSLLGICLAGLISPFIARFISYKYYFTKDLQAKLDVFSIEENEVKSLFQTLWYNAKKLGINFLGAYAINKMGMFIAGLYLSLEDISSYGLMIQLVTLIGTVSMMYFTTLEPKFSAQRVNNEQESLIRDFSFSMIVFYFLFISGCAFLIVLGPQLLNFVGSNSYLPSSAIIIAYSIVVLLEQNHSSFATIIVTNNVVPFVKAAIISGIAIVLSSFVSLQFFKLGIIGLVLSQGICQLVYNNWKWPKYVLDEFGINYFSFLKQGFIKVQQYIK